MVSSSSFFCLHAVRMQWNCAVPLVLAGSVWRGQNARAAAAVMFCAGIRGGLPYTNLPLRLPFLCRLSFLRCMAAGCAARLRTRDPQTPFSSRLSLRFLREGRAVAFYLQRCRERGRPFLPRRLPTDFAGCKTHPARIRLPGGAAVTTVGWKPFAARRHSPSIMQFERARWHDACGILTRSALQPARFRAAGFVLHYRSRPKAARAGHGLHRACAAPADACVYRHALRVAPVLSNVLCSPAWTHWCVILCRACTCLPSVHHHLVAGCGDKV